MIESVLVRRARAASTLGLLLASACGQVLGIEDARVDPTFTASGEGTPPSCSAYCDAMTAHCDGAASQYPDEFQCLAVCNQLPAGTLEAPIGNTMSCRFARVEAAASASDEARGDVCREAGPSGDAACASPCESYCELMMAVCAPETTSFSYPDADACLAECEALPQVPYAINAGVFGGNTVQCRTFYAGFAAQGTTEDCENARGLAVCVDPEATPSE